jgi:hypothetical protein
VQRALTGGGSRSPVLDVVGHGGGSALAPDVREDMESRLGASFSDVRVHTGGAAASSAASVGAHAYTVGHDVVFGAGRFDTSSNAGRTMLAHELTHVIQQRSGPVSGTPTSGGISVSDPSDRFEREAEANAARVMRSAPPAHQLPPAGSVRPDVEERAPTVQRSAEQDIDDGDAAILRGDQYAGQVHRRVDRYRRIMIALADPRNEHSDTGARMAAGYRAWSENFYNKSQAYLFEAEKASEHTKVGEHPRQRIAYLGVDADSEPDLEFVEHTYTMGPGQIPVRSQSTATAVEMKASTSARYASIDELVLGGVHQLRKRQIADSARALLLEVHLDNPRAAWPITEAAMARDYPQGTGQINLDVYRQRITTRLTKMKKTAKIVGALTAAIQVSDGQRFQVTV